MNKYVLLSVCILFLMAISAIAVAAPMGEGSAATGNESITIVGEELTVVNDTGATAGNQTAANQTDNMTQNQTMDNMTNQTMDNMTLVAMINQEQNLSILAQAINATNLTEALQTGGPYTIFAPNDEAFQALGNETLGALLNNTTTLRQILLNHVVEGNYTSAQLQTMNQTMNQTANMTQNQTMNQTDNMTQNQTMNQTDNMTQNQTMNQTDNMTQTMTQAQNMTELRTLLGTNLTVSQNQTTNEVMVNNASVIQPDINASNGVIHVVDQILLPPNMTLVNQTMGNMTGNQTMANESITIIGNQSTLVIVNETGVMTADQAMANATGNQTIGDLAIENQAVGNQTNATEGRPSEFSATIVGNQSTITYINQTT